MKSQIKGFISGALVSALVLGGAVSALAVSGNISFNLSAIKFNGEVISEAGDGYTLPNGCVAPASITYTDEKGGGTTYLPARRVSELLGVDIGWDAASGAVTIGDAAPATPDTTANAPDYSDWSAEEETEYQEWKGMWSVEKGTFYEEYNVQHYIASCNTDISHDRELFISEYGVFAQRLAYEYFDGKAQVCFWYKHGKDGIAHVEIHNENGKLEISF